jgi:hypothetical protein
VVTSVERRFKMDVGMILDLVVSDGAIQARQLLRLAERDFFDRGVGIVTCQATSSLLQKALSDAGYLCPPARMLPKRFNFVYRPTGVMGMPNDPSAISDWHLTFGDSDNA